MARRLPSLCAEALRGGASMKMEPTRLFLFTSVPAVGRLGAVSFVPSQA
jgi:hypothetical protein